MHKIANIIEGISEYDPGVSAKDNANVNSTNEIDNIVRAIGAIVVAARDMSDQDHARIRRFILAAGDLMFSRDRLQSGDRLIFEAALRDAAARMPGS
jgi:phosphopantothenate synthetase